MKKFLPDTKNIFGKDISGFTNKNILNFYDDVNNFYIKKPSANLCSKKTFKNVVLSLSHGSYKLPESFEKKVSSSKLRLLKNFSDFGTTDIVNSMGISNNQIVRAIYSRLIGDLNRDRNDNSTNGFVRKTDFNNNVIIDDVFRFRKDGDLHHTNFHNSIEKKLLEIHEMGNKSFLFDIHDTGVRLMSNKMKDDILREELFPTISLSGDNNDQYDKDFIPYFASRIEHHLGLKVLFNEPYPGGYVVSEHKNKLKLRNGVMIEIGRFLYMKESTQEINKAKAARIGQGLKNAIADTVENFTQI